MKFIKLKNLMNEISFIVKDEDGIGKKKQKLNKSDLNLLVKNTMNESIDDEKIHKQFNKFKEQVYGKAAKNEFLTLIKMLNNYDKNITKQAMDLHKKYMIEFIIRLEKLISD